MQIDPTKLEPRDIYRLMISVIVPRPIAWVSTRSPDGALNAAPFSYFQALGGKPPMVMIAIGNRRTGEPKDTRKNIEATGEFVVNIVDEESGLAMVETSIDHPYGVSEFEEAGLETLPSEMVAPPRIAGCRASLECKLDRVLELAGSGVCIGEVVLFHVDDAVLDESGVADPYRLNALGRLGGSNYATQRELISIDQSGAMGTVHGTKLDLWRELRERSIAMVGQLEPRHLALSAGDGAMTVGRMFRHLAACTAYRVLEWENRTDEDTLREWDESWTAERLAGELAADRDQFLAACRTAPRDELWKVDRMIRHEAWHQGQVAQVLRAEFGDSELWRL
ncbi:MAG: flavin reductase [Planctomycetota bacterium]